MAQSEDSGEPRGQSIANALNEEMMRALQGLPAMLEALMEGHEGPVDIPPEQASEVLQKQVRITFRYVQALAFEVDRIRFKLGLDKEPGPFGPPEDVDSQG